MKKSLIDISHSEFYPKIVSDYINHPEKLKSFYKYRPEIASFKKAIDDVANKKYNRKLLSEVITEQYSKSNLLTPFSKILAEDNTFTVCTGHQLCLFTGPLYFIYKIISTINLAEELKKNFPEHNFVPVYWIASEDHDFEEINHIHLFGKKIEWHNKQGGALGKYTNSGIEKIIEELKIVLGKSENANQLLKIFSDSYLKNKNLADATRYLVNEIFGQYGLMVIDGNDKRLKNEFSAIIKDDIFNNTNYKLVNESITELNNLSYKHQVNPRGINLFYLEKNERTRIEKPVRTQYIASLQEKNEFERFSPNVVLRPLYQQMILPNIAYVGGPNEIAYWLEYKRMFDHHKINFPVLMVRNSLMWIDQKANSLMKKFEINESDIFEKADFLINKFIRKNSEKELILDGEKENLKNIFNEISRKTENSDMTLKSSVEAELKKALHSLDQLEKKMLKAEKQKNEVAINQIKKLKEKLFPDNNLQERHENFIPYYLNYGKDFFQMLRENLNPFENRLVILQEKN